MESVECPSCESRVVLPVVQCTGCGRSLGPDVYLQQHQDAYLRAHIERWSASGTIPRPLAARLLELAARESPHQPDSKAANSGQATAPRPSMAAVSSAEVTAGVSTQGHSAGRAFHWRDVGTYLLSERTLNGLLALGALLILGSALVISALNPTHLAPTAHLGVVLGTTLLFYVSGIAVKQRLGLPRAGAGLLTIAAGLVPLNVWTLGQPALLGWTWTTVWLAASTLAFPLYLASYVLLRSRTFGLLSALAGGSEAGAVLAALGLGRDWQAAALVPLALAYVATSRHTRLAAGPLARMLYWSAYVTVPVVLVGLLVAKLGGYASDYATGTAWWSGIAFYALAARLLRRPHDAHVASGLAPIALLLTLTKTPVPSTWYGVPLAVLAIGYVAIGVLRDARQDGRPALSASPYPVALLVSLGAIGWPGAPLDGQLVTVLLLAAAYLLAAHALRVRAFAYLGVYLLLPVAYLATRWLALPLVVGGLVWIVVGATSLAVSELTLRRAGAGRASTVDLAMGVAATRSLFAPPLVGLGWVSLVVAVLEPTAVRDQAGIVWTLLGALAVATLAAVYRREPSLSYPVAALIPVWVVLSAMLWWPGQWQTVLAGAFALMAPGYLWLAKRVGKSSRRVEWPWMVGAYVLSVGAPLSAVWSAGGRTTPELAVSLGAIALAYAATLVPLREPAWGFPTAAVALAAYGAIERVVFPEASPAQVAAGFVLPAWALGILADAALRRGGGRGLPLAATLRGNASGGVVSWAAAPLLFGAATVVGSSAMATVEHLPGLAVALAYAVLLGIGARLYADRLQLVVSALFGVVAVEEALLLANVNPAQQPPIWAGLGVILSAIPLVAGRVDKRAAWLTIVSRTGALLALGAALAGVLVSPQPAAGLPRAAVTSLLAGLAVASYAWQTRNRLYGYAAVGLAGAGGTLQLLASEVQQPQLYVAPAGAYLLGIAYLEWRRAEWASLKGVFEWAGLALLLSVSLVQALGLAQFGATILSYQVWLFLESLGLFGLGAVLRWRRTFFAGAVALVADVVLLLGDPVRAIDTWYLLGIVGLTMVGLVVFVEQRRQQIPLWLDGWRQRLEAWD